MLTANDIRHKFIKFFENRGHTHVASSSLVPKDDPSLLFTNAGMVQFKRAFLGQDKPGYVRATTAQKCLRVGGKHNDLENVGRTARHHTFFEMMGNFSFGDYFKEDAIKFAWEFLTEDLKLPKDRLYVTVFKDDDEAIELWTRHTGISLERIFRLGEKDNFWSMGDTGPCGPCSEVLIDQGEHMKCGDACGIGQCDCDRFLEIWNLVFMQYDQLGPGKREKLPKPSIDTGLGLERVAAVCQGVDSNYDTDLFQGIIQYACELAGVSYQKSAPNTNDGDTALRVIADHSRALAFMISDGILPSNEGRGYVLRRLIRRAYRFGRLINLKEPFLYKTALKVVELMGDDYPELRENADFMSRVVREEEERFERTLDKGLGMLEDILAGLAAAGKQTLSGEDAFKLYDTYGFPIDIVNDIAEAKGFAVDALAFDKFMTEQKERAKAAWKGSGEVDLAGRFTALLEDGLTSEFVGYSTLQAHSRIIALLNADAADVELLPAGQKGYLVAGQTPFYGESGGQTGDLGSISTSSGTALVLDTLKPSQNLTVHHIEVVDGEIRLDAEADLKVGAEERLAVARNHTSTHLLHAALRRVLGGHVQQAGSLVSPERLRFDFTHIAALSPEELLAVEKDVNRMIMADLPISTELLSMDAAKAKGAIGLFEDKYGSEVRVVTAGDESMELCGGTHLSSTGQAGMFSILSESGVAAGVRRIEASTGWNTLSLWQNTREEIAEISALVKARPGELLTRVQALQQELRSARKEMERLAAQAASGKGKDIMSDVIEINGLKALLAETNAPNIKALRDLMDDVRSKLASGVICLAAKSPEDDGKIHLIVAVSKDLLERFPAPALIKEIAPFIGGSGGGRPDMAQAGGTNAAGLTQAFDKLKELLGK